MQITLRLEQILTAIAACPFVESKNISFEERPPDAGYISGAISFTDASILHVKEYLIFKSSAMSIVKYGYHYLSEDGSLIFRYDNALDPKIKAIASFPSHKHTPEGIVSSSRPSLDELMTEISGVIGRTMKM